MWTPQKIRLVLLATHPKNRQEEMKPISAIDIPSRLALRPRWRGLPIPYIATIKPDGEADFRLTDEAKRLSVMVESCCQLCGQPLGRFKFFTGGPQAAAAMAYFEPAAHLDCLIYAMQVCPFIAGKMEHAPVEDVQRDHPTMKVMVDKSYTTVKSPDWVIVKATNYTLIRQSDQTILVRPTGVLLKTGPLRCDQMTAADWTFITGVLKI